MNKLRYDLVRVVAAFLLGPVPLATWGQGQDRLTEEMRSLSPKERSKLAAKETEEAATDSSYQQAMREAESAFRTADYEEALKSYQRARELRPYNVYPKVKIQDLQALLKKRQEDVAKTGTAPVPHPATNTGETGSGPSTPVPEPTVPPKVDLQERVYSEAGAVVTERTIEENGRPVTYKRVVHRSGQVFHFKDGHAIPAQVWQDVFR